MLGRKCLALKRPGLGGWNSRPIPEEFSSKPLGDKAGYLTFLIRAPGILVSCMTRQSTYHFCHLYDTAEHWSF